MELAFTEMGRRRFWREIRRLVLDMVHLRSD